MSELQLRVLLCPVCVWLDERLGERVGIDFDLDAELSRYERL